MTAPLLPDEDVRLRALRDCGVLDTPSEDEFDDITRLAAHLCGVPISAVSLVDAERQWFKSITGLAVRETPRAAAFCAHTILQDEVMVVPDARADARFAGNPLVTGDPNIRFYAGAPLVTEDGHALGSLCVIDRQPKQLTPEQREALRLLARLVTSQLEKARRAAERARAEAALEAEREFTGAVLESLQEGIVACDADGRLTLFNRAARELHGLPAESLPAEQWAEHLDLYAADGLTPLRTEDIPLFRALQGEAVRGAELVVAPRLGPARTLLANGQAVRNRAGRKLGAVVAMHDITDRRQTERELARLAAIVESSEEAILAATLDGTIVSWNRGAEQLYGYAAAEMVGRHASVLANGEGRGPVPAIVTRLLRGEPVDPVEVARVRRDGTGFHALLTFSPIRDASAQVIGLSCIARDITAQKEAEAALAESEARLRRLTDAAFEGIAVSQDGALVEVSPAFAALFGYASPAEMVGLPASLLVSPANPALVLQQEADCDDEPYEATLRRRDGSPLQAEMRGRMIRLGGRPARVTAVRDISEQRAMEEALRASEARFRTSVDAMEEGLALQDENGSILFCNEGAERILGLSADQMRGRTSMDARWRAVRADGTDFPGDQHPAMVALRECAPQSNVVMGIHKPDGAMTWVNINAVPLLCEAHGGCQAPKANGVVVTFSDITERRRAEEALRESNQALQESQRFARSVTENSASFIFVFDLDTNSNVYANRDMAEFLGYASEQAALGAGLLPSVIHPDDLPRLLAHFAAFEQAGEGGIGDDQVIEFEYRARHADGGWRWIWNRDVVFERHPDGRPRRILGNAQDVTAQKALEEDLRAQAERLRRSEASLRAVLESAPVILYAADAGGTVTLSEGTGLAALGLTPGEAVGRSVFEFSGGDAEIEAATRRALAGAAVSYDARVYGLCLHTELRPLRDADGSPGGLIGVCFDVTERVASEERFRVLFERSSDAHLLVDEGGIVDCNAAAVALLGCADKAHLLSLHPSRLSPEFQPDGRRSHEKGMAMDALARADGFHRFEWTHRRMDGSEFPAEVALTPVTLADRPVLLAVCHDLTERKRAEETVRDHAVVLEFQKRALEQANAELAALATTDGMTGLKNHRAFQEQLAEEVSRAGRYHTPLSLIVVDVDHFKGFNDALGHPAGDAVLKAVAGLLQGGARETDFVARYGGEEFVLLLPQTDADGAVLLAERLRAAVASASWPLRPVTASFGVANLRLGIEDGGALLARADDALYLSKSAGRNRVTASGGAALPLGLR